MRFRITALRNSVFFAALPVIAAAAPATAEVTADEDGTVAAAASGPLFDCDRELIKLIAGSNHALVRAEKVTADRLGIYIENRDINELAIQLSDTRQKPSPESPGAGQLGWVTYNIKDNTLTATGADIEHPVPLTFSAVQGEQLQSCLKKEKTCQQILSTLRLTPFIAMSPEWRVTGKGRAYFHAAPAQQCRDDNTFVVPGDVLQVTGLRATEPVKGEKESWLLVAYGNTQGWINVNRLESQDDLCGAATEKADKQYQAGLKNNKPSSYKYSVTQKRLRFYDAPDKKCSTNAADYVVKDDAVWVDRPQPYQGFVHGRYIHPATGKVTEGWLDAGGLKK
ncbi:hypothetical protein N0392_05490 [Morganella morganii]|uniref:SH3 domain-containing protein n=1 Tax=Morganella morganii TaxID=582 RepID=A0A9Q4CMR4_MORMO|nr:hypothetical protein [Morganella morganii]MCY0789144.1 hypothetical protein [Morganella morganii]